MKYLFLYILLGLVLSQKTFKQRTFNAAFKMKALNPKKYKLRNYQNIPSLLNTEINSLNDTETVFNIPFPEDINSSTVAPPIIFNDIVKIESLINKPKVNGNLSSGLHIIKFHNFRRVKENLVKFRIFFYFIDREIPENIFLRTIILYKSKLRYLEEIKGESIRTACVIMNEYKDRLELIGAGENVDYDCTIQTTSSAEILNAFLSTSNQIIVGREVIEFHNINIGEEAAEEATNLVKISNLIKLGYLSDAIVELPLDNDYFRINGYLGPKEAFEINDKIQMEFYDINDGTNIRSITCKIIQINNPRTIIQCNTDDEPLKFYVGNLTLARSLNQDTYFKINTRKAQDNDLVQVVPSKNQNINIGISYGKRSNKSKLSGRAIAGMAVGFGILIIGSIILALVLKKYQNKNNTLSNTETKTIVPNTINNNVFDPNTINNNNDKKINDNKMNNNISNNDKTNNIIMNDNKIS